MAMYLEDDEITSLLRKREEFILDDLNKIVNYLDKKIEDCLKKGDFEPFISTNDEHTYTEKGIELEFIVLTDGLGFCIEDNTCNFNLLDFRFSKNSYEASNFDVEGRIQKVRDDLDNLYKNKNWKALYFYREDQYLSEPDTNNWVKTYFFREKFLLNTLYQIIKVKLIKSIEDKESEK